MAKNKAEKESAKDSQHNNSHYIYVLECSDGSLYTGYTTDVQRRLDEHNSGQGAKQARGRLPVKLRHQEAFESRSLAQKREYQIKQLPRSQKEELID